MAKSSIKRASAIKIMIPDDRMVAIIFSSFIGTLIQFKQNVDIRVNFFVVIQFIKSFPRFRSLKIQPTLFGMLPQYVNLLLMGMTFEPGPYQFSIPPPFVFRIRSSMNTYKSSTGLNVAHEFILLELIEHVSSGTQKNNGTVFF